MEQEWMGVAETIAMTGISRTRLHAMVAAGEIPAYRVRRTLRFRRNEIKQWIEAQRIVPKGEGQ